MALIEIQFHSNQLDLNTNIYVIKPNVFSNNENLKVLYLLHGYQGDYTNWVKYTRVLKYVEGTNLLVVMPSAYNSYYIDNELTGKYFSYLTEELPNLINKTFNITQTKENTFIVGLSMGGYGALKTALTYPDRYSKAVSFSGVTKLENVISRTKDGAKKKAEIMFTNDIIKENSLFNLAKKSLNKTSLYITCGTEDFLFAENNEFHEYLNNLNFKHIYLTSPGVHSWDYWDEQFKLALKWLLD